MSYASGPWAAQAQAVMREREATKPNNTKIAYDPKLKEFFQFCDSVYASDPNPRLVTEDKLFIFLYYHAYRGHKDTKTKRDEVTKEKIGDSYKPGFNRADFDAVINQWRSNEFLVGNTQGPAPSQDVVETRLRDEEKSKKRKLVGHSCVNQYFQAIKRHWQHQVDMKTTSITPEQLVSQRVKDLLNLVKSRKQRVKEANCEEKITGAVSPFLVLGYIGPIERLLFDKNSNSMVHGMAALRNRFFFLKTLQSLLRGESIFKCELSDLVCFHYHSRKEPHPYHFLVMQVSTGKTNKERTLFGRCLRHKDVLRCATGALGLYLIQRFHVTKELQWLDFTSNENWFRQKLMVDSNFTRESLKKSMSDRSVADQFKAICHQAGCHPNHFLHFGRAEGPVELELEELDPGLIKILGNWNPDTQEDRYSTKMPVKAMRVAAGFDSERGTHYIPRVMCLAPPELAKQVFPEVEAIEAKLHAAEQASGDVRLTAWEFLSFLKSMRQVILQDAALLIAQGRRHAVFGLPVFRTQAFKNFQSATAAYVAAAATDDPRNAKMDAVLPLVYDHFGNLQATTNAGFVGVHGRLDGMQGQLNGVQGQMNTMVGFIHHLGQFDSARYSVPTQTAPVEPQRPPLVAAAREEASGSPPVGGFSTREDTPGLPVETYLPDKEYSSVTSIYNDWHGIGSHSGPPGGIKHQETQTKKKWRQHWDGAHQKRLSRMKAIVKAISKTEDQSQATLAAILGAMDSLYAGKGKSLSKLETYLKSQGGFIHVQDSTSTTSNVEELTEFAQV